MQQSAALRVRIEAPDLDDEEMDRLTRQLWSELRDNTDADRVELVETTESPMGTKGATALDLGIVAVQVLPTAVPSVISAIRGWTARKPRQTAMKVSVKVENRELSLEYPIGTMTNEQMMELITYVTKAPAPPSDAAGTASAAAGETVTES
jgi:hypothetical protein